MAILDAATNQGADGFDTYTTLSQKYTVEGTPTIGAFGRNSTNGVQINNNNEGILAGIPAVSTVIVAVAFILNTVSSGADVPIIALWDGGTLQVDLRLDVSGHFFFTRNGTLMGARSTNAIIEDVYHHLEFQVTINNATGSIELRVDGTATGWIQTTGGLDTQNTANASVNGVRLQRE